MDFPTSVPTISLDLDWQRASPEEAMTNIIMLLDTQLLRGLERFDWRKADKHCEVCFWNWFLNLQYKVSTDFAEKVRRVLLTLPLAEARTEIVRLWNEHEKCNAG